MKKQPSDNVVHAWTQLVRSEQTVLGRIDACMKEAGLPPLAWYDVLLELDRETAGRLRPVELERRLLLTQYNISRLLDRMGKAGLISREVCTEDGRGQWVVISPEGQKVRRRMWRVYGAAIERFVGSKLTAKEATELGTMLTKLI